MDWRAKLALFLSFYMYIYCTSQVVLTNSQGITLPSAGHDEQLSVGRENQVAYWGCEIVKDTRRLRSSWNACFRLLLLIPGQTLNVLRMRLRHPLSSVVNVDNAAGTANGYPPVSAKLFSPRLASQIEHGRPDSSLVYPARDDSALATIPLGHFTILTGNRHALAVAPPGKVRDASTAIDSDFGDPLSRPRIQDIDQTSALARCPNESHVPAARRQLEPFHGFLFLSSVRRAVHLVDLACVQIPDMEVPAPAGEEYLTS